MQDAKGRDAAGLSVEDALEPGMELPFAWDEPTAEHTLCVVAQLRDMPSGCSADEGRSSECFLDIDSLPSLRLKPLVICSNPPPPRQDAEGSNRIQDSTMKMLLEGALSEVCRRQVRVPCQAQQLGLSHARLTLFHEGPEGVDGPRRPGAPCYCTSR
jgi:hypothetical protein